MRYWFLLLWACDGSKLVVEERDVDTAVLVDEDGDGYYNDEDCDDGNSNVNPGNIEICDGVDNNCNDEIDEGVEEIFYLDEDDDGFGNPDVSEVACEALENYVSNGNDCDDENSNVYPSAPEQCDDVDNDCDEEIDEDLIERWFIDQDQDGYGDSEIWEDTCLPEDDYVGNADDCDDMDPNIYPEALEECDGIDNDCNGDIDEGVLTEYFVDADEDGYGNEDTTVEACEVSTGVTLFGGDCDDIDPSIYPGADEYCDGDDNNCDGNIDESTSVDASSWFFDDDADGFGDLNTLLIQCDQPNNYVSDQTDCDDSDATLYPGANELCDGQINDCSLSILPLIETDDDGDGYVECTIDSNGWDGTLITGGNDCDDGDSSEYPGVNWYADSDGDSYGNPNSSNSCEQNSSTDVLDNTDCNDGEDTIYPSASELCDGQINDCNTSSLASDETDDDGDGYVECTIDSNGWDGTSITGGNDCDDTSALYNADTIWYADSDGDSYGDPSVDMLSCQQPSGYVLDNTDCDDSDSGMMSITTDGDCDGVLTVDDCDDSDASVSGLGSGASCAAVSCLDILNDGSSIGDGTYWIDPDGSGGSTPYNVYCDMTTNGGGWTALVNPQGYGLPTKHPNLSTSAAAVSGAGSCPPNTSTSNGNGWYSVSGYACGNFTARFTLSWSNDIGATDVMFMAALQGQQTRTLTVNGINIGYDAFSNAYMKCAFWNSSSSSSNPGTNLCYQTYLNVDPHVYNNQLSGNLSMVITTGAACSPDCQHGTGFNVQKLFVR